MGDAVPWRLDAITAIGVRLERDRRVGGVAVLQRVLACLSVHCEVPQQPKKPIFGWPVATRSAVNRSFRVASSREVGEGHVPELGHDLLSGLRGSGCTGDDGVAVRV